MNISGTYLIVRKGSKAVPVILPSTYRLREAVKLLGLTRKDVISGGRFVFCQGLHVSGLAFQCESADDSSYLPDRITSQWDEDSLLLQELFEDR